MTVISFPLTCAEILNEVKIIKTNNKTGGKRVGAPAENSRK
jgi:hypothetical protein